MTNKMKLSMILVAVIFWAIGAGSAQIANMLSQSASVTFEKKATLFGESVEVNFAREHIIIFPASDANDIRHLYPRYRAVVGFTVNGVKYELPTYEFLFTDNPDLPERVGDTVLFNLK